MKSTCYVFFLFSCLFILKTSSLDIRKYPPMFEEANKQTIEALNSGKTQKFIITTILYEPFLKLKEDEEAKGNEIYEGYVKDLADLLANKLGFSYEMRLVKDSKYGQSDNEGVWNGMIGEVMRNEADMAIAPITITYHRQKVVDFTTPFMTSGISVMVKRPSTIDEDSYWFFLAPFTKELWICIIFSCVGVAIFSFIVIKFSSYDVKGNEVSSKQSSEKENVNYKVLNTLKAIIQHQNYAKNRSASKKIIECVFCFFVVILIAWYTANLTIFLTMKSVFLPIQNVEKLSRQSDVEYGLIQGGSTQAFFQDSKWPVYIEMWNFMKSRKNVFVSNSQEGISKVRNSNGKYAFFVESVVNDYFNGQPPCDTVRLGRNLNSIGYGIIVAKGHPLRDRLNAAIIMLGSDGTLTSIQNKWLYKSSHCEENRDLNEGQEKITLGKAAGLFYLLIVGLILSLLVAIGEYCFKSRQDSEKKRGYQENPETY